MIKLLLLAFKSGALLKLALSGGTMLLSLVLYASVWGWPYAAGFMACLFLHELGHVVAARQRGLAVSMPAFIPFMGAFITMREQPHDAETEAHVAIGGPLLGTVAAFGFYFVGDQTGERLYLAIAYAGFVLNLFNLIPLSPLDGGRILSVLGPRVWLFGVPLLVAAMVYSPSPLLILIGIMAAPRVWQALRHQPGTVAYYEVQRGKKFEYAGMYFGLVAALGVMAFEVHERLGGG